MNLLYYMLYAFMYVSLAVVILLTLMLLLMCICVIDAILDSDAKGFIKKIIFYKSDNWVKKVDLWFENKDTKIKKKEIDSGNPRW